MTEHDDTITRLHAVAADLEARTDDAAHHGSSAAETEIAQLKVAVEHRTIIGHAVGILMERYRLDAGTAFNVLAKVSQDTNRKVYAIALEFSTTGNSSGFGPAT